MQTSIIGVLVCRKVEKKSLKTYFCDEKKSYDKVGAEWVFHESEQIKCIQVGEIIVKSSLIDV